MKNTRINFLIGLLISAAVWTGCAGYISQRVYGSKASPLIRVKYDAFRESTTYRMDEIKIKSPEMWTARTASFQLMCVVDDNNKTRHHMIAVSYKGKNWIFMDELEFKFTDVNGVKTLRSVADNTPSRNVYSGYVTEHFVDSIDEDFITYLQTSQTIFLRLNGGLIDKILTQLEMAKIKQYYAELENLISSSEDGDSG